MKHAKLYLTKIKQYRLKIKFLSTVFLLIPLNGQETSLLPQTMVLTSNVRTKDLLLPPQKERMRTKSTENVPCRKREREFKMLLGVDSQ